MAVVSENAKSEGGDSMSNTLLERDAMPDAHELP